MNNNESKIQNWYLHIDLDAFFASVEQLDNPEYRGKPVIVGGRKDDKRGVVSTASYEARKFGVHSAMPLFQAIRLCPKGIFVRGRMERYAELSYKIMNIFKEFSPDVEQMSIDEAFIDLTGTEMLFGPPEETALKVKKRVKEETGLTVSVGLATTKYLAKIASGYSKPDGFYFIKPGQEQSFMLQLPLKKVWGVGPKALERLKKAGIHTTKDIYDKPFDLLEFIFGTTMATFLYNVVRGEEKESFTKKRKSHSISAEKTFSCDITDIYTAETELLELAHGVLFRLLKEEKFSRTVTVKIKYDDFTSVSIQKTLDRNIITLDTFFDNIKVLFEEKYQKGRGIRLLGVGFDKVESNERPFQQSLFDNKEDKKQAVEKAILNLNKKHPEIKIQKARLLKSITVLFIIFLQFTSYGYTEEKPGSNENNNETGAIFNWDINDKNKVDFTISGYWQGELTGSLSGIFGKDSSFFLDTPIPVFKQDIELSTMFTLNKKWYFEADFVDNFANNTLTLGYNGDGYFRSGKISNRDITMPNNYSAEELGFGLSGGNNQAPGLQAHWQSPTDKWSGDLLLRYDMTTPKTATFYGLNKVTDHTVTPENYLYGYSFTFPEDSKNHLQNIKNIYVESPYGTYKDVNGRKYKKLSASDYYYSQSLNTLYLSQKSDSNKKNNIVPTVLVTFLSSSSVQSIINSTGTYDNINSFAGNIQALFNKSDKKYNLNDFSYPLQTTIENNDALVIQNTTGFSPYLIKNNYNVGKSKNSEISIISKHTKTIIPEYIAEIENNSYIYPDEDFFGTTDICAKVSKKNDIGNSYPFVQTNPEFYLNLPSQSDIGIQIRSFSPVSQINIGQSAAAGTIQVLRNGSYISDFIYDINTGNITFSKPINGTDQIRIIWAEEASNFAKGALALGIGFQLNILPNLKWDIALTGKKPLSFKEKYSTPDHIQNSFAALSTGINFTKGNFSIYDKAAFSVYKQNDLDKLLVSSQNDFSPNSYKQKENSGIVTKTSPYLNGKVLSEKQNYTVKSHTGEKDINLQAYKIPLSWDFSATDNITESWAAVDLKLEGGIDLKNSSQLELMLNIPSPISNKYKIYLQLGVKAGETVITRNQNIPTFDITEKLNLSNNSWQKVNIVLSDKDRAYLTSNNDGRIIIIPTASMEDSDKKGKIYIGTYKTIPESVFANGDENIFIYTSSIPSSKESFSSTVNWSIPANQVLENTVITASTNFIPSDFRQYKTINFNIAYETQSLENNENPTTQNKPELSIILDTNSISRKENGNIALKLDLYNIRSYISNIKKYHTISVNIKNKDVYIDNILLEKSDYNLQLNSNIVPSRAKYDINTTLKDKVVTKGSFYIDNITYEDSDYNYAFHNKISTQYSKDNILSVSNFSTPIFQNGHIKAQSSQKITKDNFTLMSSLDTGITITGIALQTDMYINKSVFENVGHSVKTTRPILHTLSFAESYRWNKPDSSLQKTNNFNLSLDNFKIPLSITSSLSAKENNIQNEQNHITNVNSNFSIKDFDFDITSSLATNQKINLLKTIDITNLNTTKNKHFNDNYFDSWFNISKFQFSTGNENASTRNTIFANSFNINMKNYLISPKIEYNLSSSYNNVEIPQFTDKTTLNILVPFTIKNNFISFNLSKNGGDTNYINPENKNYFTDLEKLFTLQNERDWFYTTIPFYELFDDTLPNKVKGTYSTKYEVQYTKPISNSFRDLFIPSSGTFAIERDIKSKNNFSDTYQIKLTLSNYSINNFGRNSHHQIFKWFDQEEINSGITTIVKVPTDLPENTTYSVTAYLQLLFLINDKSILNTYFDMTFETNNNWHTKGSIVYTRPGKTCLMSAIASLFSEKANTIDFDITRKDYFNFSIGTTDKINRQQYEYNHSVDMGFLKYFTLSTGIGATFTYVENSNNTLSLNYSIGGKVSF